jgi:hypothetical protein
VEGRTREEDQWGGSRQHKSLLFVASSLAKNERYKERERGSESKRAGEQMRGHGTGEVTVRERI